MYTLINDLSAGIHNPNVAYNQSWVHVHNDANRALFSQAAYITNFDDLSISLSASDIDIGAIEIKDWNSNLRADVTSSDGLNALRVLSQDLESSVDDITIGDKNGNFAAVYPTLSALKVYITNPTVTYIPYSYTQCETRTTGNPSFSPKQILIHNLSNNDVDVNLTLTSGLSCTIPVGKSTSVNHMITLNLAVSTVDKYNGCSINFFA